MAPFRWRRGRGGRIRRVWQGGESTLIRCGLGKQHRLFWKQIAARFEDSLKQGISFRRNLKIVY